MSFTTNIHKALEGDSNFRKVLFTGAKSQLVLMEIPPGEDVGDEVHERVEQTLFFMKGHGKAVLDGKEYPIEPGSVFIVAPGTRHNFMNTGSESLEIYTVYVPPNHIDGRIHKTKADAEADIEDEEFGHKV